MAKKAPTGLVVEARRLADEQRYSFGVTIDGAFIEFATRPAGGIDSAIAAVKAANEPPPAEDAAEPAGAAEPPAQQLSDEGEQAEQVEALAEPEAEPEQTPQQRRRSK